jgi:hypothetical protein
MKKPNFFIIGAPKCGTTSLYEWLAEHPKIFMSNFKEPHYFNTDDTFRSIVNEADYMKLFDAAGSEHQAVGEGSTWYFFSKSAVSNIENFTAGEAKYIVCLRNPLEMVHSLHAQNIFSGNESVTDFEEAWSLQKARSRGDKLPILTNAASHLQYYDSCLLGMMSERLLNIVPRRRVHFILLEDMIADPKREFERVLQFLGISNSCVPINFAVKNKAHRPKSILVTRLISLGSLARRTLGLRRGIGILTRIRNANKLEMPRSTISPEMLQVLTETFKADISKLEETLDRDLSHWSSM